VVEYERRKERLLMKTRPEGPRHGDLARGGERLPRSEGRMYQPIRQHYGLRRRTLGITFLASDAAAYSCTFGRSGDGDG
jgi:hypothetical protein